MRRLLSQIAAFGAFVAAGFGAAFAGAPRWAVITIAVLIYLPLTFLIDRWAPARVPTPSEARQRELRKTIGLLALGLVFSTTGVLVLRSNWRVSLVTVALFGGCSIVFLDILLRRLHERRLRSLGIDSVGIIGSIDIPIARGRYLAVALGFTAVGVIMYAAGTEYPALFRIGALVIAAVGLGFLAALPVISRQRIRFDPQGILIGTLRFQYRVPWDGIRGVGLHEQASNPLVTLELWDPALIAVEPPSRRAAFLRRVATAREWYAADVVIAGQFFGLQAALLTAAIGRYAGDPSARGELALRLLESDGKWHWPRLMMHVWRLWQSRGRKSSPR